MGLLDLNYKISRQLEEIEKEHSGRQLEKLEKQNEKLKDQRRSKIIQVDLLELLEYTIKQNYYNFNFNLLEENTKAKIIESVVQCILYSKDLTTSEVEEIRRLAFNNYFTIYCKIERIESKKIKIEKEHRNIIKQKNNIYNIDGLESDQIFNKLKNIL